MTTVIALATILGLALLVVVTIAHHPPAALAGVHALVVQVTQARQALHCLSTASSPLPCAP